MTTVERVSTRVVVVDNSREGQYKGGGGVTVERVSTRVVVYNSREGQYKGGGGV